MKNLPEYKENIHSCSKCGICQSVCPLYKITGNDCNVTRGMFIMLKRFINGDIKMTKRLNKYLDTCLKCGECSRFCPSDINVVEIITAAKAEYFKTHFAEKLISACQRIFVFGIGMKIFGLLSKNQRSKNFEKKVIYFGGCGSKIKGNKSVVRILNACNIEVITPDFDCCGIPFFVRGDLDSYENYKNKFGEILKKYDIKDIVTTCASCEKTLRDYNFEGVSVKNIFEYIRENNLQIKLKKRQKVTFHKPCNIENYDDILWVLNNTDGIEYVEMQDFNKCCGLNGITKFSEYRVLSSIFKSKRENIIKSEAKIVLTSCLGCETALRLFSFGRYKIMDFTEFLAKNSHVN